MQTEWIELATDSQGYDAASAAAPDIVQSFRQSEEYAAIDAVWQSHAHAEGVSESICREVSLLPSQLHRLYLLASDAFSETFSPTLAVSRPPEDPLIDWQRVRADAARLINFSQGDLPVWLAEANYASQTARDVVLSTEQFCAFQDRAISAKELRVPDLATGLERAARDSYHTYGRGVYLFGGMEPYYLLTGGAGHKASAIYVPARRLIIDLRAGNKKILSPDVLATTFAAQVKRLADHNEDFAKSMAMAEATIHKSKLVLMAGQIENPAHHIWNFYPGIEKIVRGGHSANIDELQTFGSEFLGRFTNIFPEFSDRHTHSPRAAIHSLNPFDPSSLLFQTGGYFITEMLKQRLLKTSAASAATLPATDVPYVWFGLRVGSRSWADQAEEIPLLIAQILAKEPRAQFVLDGFNYPVGEDNISQKWQTAIQDIGDIARSIIKSSPPSAIITNLVGQKLDQALVFAAKTAVYVTPIGSTQHKVGWFSQGDGIIYSGPNILTTRPDRRPGCWEVENILVPKYVIGSSVSSGERRSINDNRPNLENIKLDFDDILQRILDSLKNWQGLHS